MIICHPHKLIFIKTKKVAGTSFEIALSKFCGDHCTITPNGKLSNEIREKMGIRGPQNYIAPQWSSKRGGWSYKTNMRFIHHNSSEQVRENIPEIFWNNYRKVAIFRNPFDAWISRYYYRGGEKGTGLAYDDFIKENRDVLHGNTMIAPLHGVNKLDHYLRYENLEEDIKVLGIDGLYETFSQIKAKGNKRPARGTSVAEMYAIYPEAASLIAERCKEEIEFFNYPLPFEK